VRFQPPIHWTRRIAFLAAVLLLPILSQGHTSTLEYSSRPQIVYAKSNSSQKIHGQKANKLLGLCLKKSISKSNPYLRDEERKRCMLRYKNNMKLSQCFKMCETFEYSGNEDQMKFFCMSELADQMNFKSCFAAAKSMESLENSEDARWLCFEKFHTSLDKKTCLIFSQKMLFSYNRKRIETSCQ
jgi:hypothetical protein